MRGRSSRRACFSGLFELFKMAARGGSGETSHRRWRWGHIFVLRITVCSRCQLDYKMESTLQWNLFTETLFDENMAASLIRKLIGKRHLGRKNDYSRATIVLNKYLLASDSQGDLWRALLGKIQDVALDFLFIESKLPWLVMGLFCVCEWRR